MVIGTCNRHIRTNPNVTNWPRNEAGPEPEPSVLIGSAGPVTVRIGYTRNNMDENWLVK